MLRMSDTLLNEYVMVWYECMTQYLWCPSLFRGNRSHVLY